MKMYQQQVHNLMEENDFYTFLKVLQKYKLCYQFKQSLKELVNEYQFNGDSGTWPSLIARAFIQNKKSWVQEMKNILLDTQCNGNGIYINNHRVIGKTILFTLNLPSADTTNMIINEICNMIEK